MSRNLIVTADNASDLRGMTVSFQEAGSRKFTSTGIVLAAHPAKSGRRGSKLGSLTIRRHADNRAVVVPANKVVA